ncbi:MAG: ATP-binding cassette domain-containing protein [Planctomycetia bacterium]|nr:MAG: ATP-binding cassette domain-containing protein [Planctomycetia bacterium]RIK71053.1 MAG: ABC transporter ATP-binding protein [Planctomycetota bacterium]
MRSPPSGGPSIALPGWFANTWRRERVISDRNRSWTASPGHDNGSAVVAAAGRTPHLHEPPLTGVPPFRRLIRLFANDRRDIGLVLLFSVIVGILTLATPITVQALVNFVSFGGLIQPLVVLGILLFGFLALAGTIRVVQAFVIEILQRRLFVRVLADLSLRLPRVTAECFDRGNGPELVNRFFDIVTVQKVAAMLLLDGASVLLQIFVGLVILAFYHPFLLAFDVLLILSIIFVMLALGRGAVRTAIAESRAKYAVVAALEEMARYPIVFKLAGASDFARERADALAVDYVECRRTHFSIVLRQTIGFLATQVFAATTLLTLGGFLVIDGQLTLGQLVAAELIVSGVLASLAKFGKTLESVYDLLAAVDKLGQLFDLPLERDDGVAMQPVRDGARLELRGVMYAFPEQPPVIHDFSLSVAPREHVCIVGRHGSGKSLLADMLIGLRRPTAGTIALDGADLREISLASLREHVALVRGTEIVEGTVEENVRMSRRDIPAEVVRDALQRVGILERIRELPDGLRTHLAPTGAPLSPGQAGRLMVARAMIGRPQVLVLDDLLDDLDEEAREHVLNAVMAPDASWSVLILGSHEIGRSRGARIVRLDRDPEPANGGAVRPRATVTT